MNKRCLPSPELQAMFKLAQQQADVFAGPAPTWGRPAEADPHTTWRRGLTLLASMATVATIAGLALLLEPEAPQVASPARLEIPSARSADRPTVRATGMPAPLPMEDRRGVKN